MGCQLPESRATPSNPPGTFNLPRRPSFAGNRLQSVFVELGFARLGSFLGSWAVDLQEF